MIHIPLWLQNDPESKKSLFFHLLGSKRSSRRGVTDIGRETNCGIQIHFNPDLHQHQPPITITVDACNARTAQSDQLNALQLSAYPFGRGFVTLSILSPFYSMCNDSTVKIQNTEM